MPDLFADVARELPNAGSRGPWVWYPGLGHDLTVKYQGKHVANLLGPDRYDYLVRLMAAAPHADA